MNHQKFLIIQDMKDRVRNGKNSFTYLGCQFLNHTRAGAFRACWGKMKKLISNRKVRGKQLYSFILVSITGSLCLRIGGRAVVVVCEDSFLRFCYYAQITPAVSVSVQSCMPRLSSRQSVNFASVQSQITLTVSTIKLRYQCQKNHLWINAMFFSTTSSWN